jgi:hypothetical protein
MWGWYHITNTDSDGDDAKTIIEEAETDDGPYNIADAQACSWSCDWRGVVSACNVARRQQKHGSADVRRP